MQPSSYPDIVRRIRELAPFLDDTSAKAALSAFVGALGAMLTRAEQATLAEALPAEVAQILRREEPWAQKDTPNVFRMVAARRNVPVSQAIEQTIVVCRVLGEVLAPSARARLIRCLPALGRLVQPAEDFAAPPAHGARMAREPSDSTTSR